MNPADDLAERLAPRPAAANEPTPQSLFAQTFPVLRRRVRLRWLGRVSALAICLAVGYGLGLASAPTKIVVVEVSSPSASIPETPAQPSAPPPVPEPSAAQLEMQAELSDISEEVARLYREAGDKYLKVERDYPRATRCYRMHLQALNRPAPELRPDDTWLLASLKPH